MVKMVVATNANRPKNAMTNAKRRTKSLGLSTSREWERNSEAEMAAGDEPFVIVDGSVGYTTRSILLAKMEQIGIDKFPEEHVSNVAMDLPVGYPEQPITAHFTVTSIKNKR